ncbi:MAG TPA: hypothetical protein VNS19_06885 [Acidimicrobiales bacterium]|nr:hypothetical protein [Acidimicrobiales bacterium]
MSRPTRSRRAGRIDAFERVGDGRCEVAFDRPEPQVLELARHGSRTERLWRDETYRCLPGVEGRERLMKRSMLTAVVTIVMVVGVVACDPQGDEVRKGTNHCYGSATACLDLDVFWNTQQCSGREFVKETRLAYRWRQLDPQFTVRNVRGKLGYLSLVGCDGRLGVNQVRAFSRAAPAAGQWYQINATSSFAYHSSRVDQEASGAWVAGDVYRGSSKKGLVCVQQLWRDNGGDACEVL